MLSAPGAALFAGCGWWRAVIERARGEYPGVPIDDILDCADAPGLALGALRIGQRRLVLSPTSPGWQSVAAIAASLGGEVLTSRAIVGSATLAMPPSSTARVSPRPIVRIAHIR